MREKGLNEEKYEVKEKRAMGREEQQTRKQIKSSGWRGRKG